jgi:Xaa-Pro aminopeptidase
MFDLSAIQSALQHFGLDGWLLMDFRGSNILARRVLDLEARHPQSRRLFYFIPASGAPQKLVHRIESGALDHLPGEKRIYLAWQQLETQLAELVGGLPRRVAMEYSPRNGNPYISRVDGGTIDVIRATGVEIVSSGDLIQLFEAAWSDEQWESHLEANRYTTAAYDLVWKFVADELRAGRAPRETEVQQLIMDHFHRHGLTTYSPPIIGVNAHSGDPHYAPEVGNDADMRTGDFLLVDLWAKMDRPGAVYSDLTRVGFLGEQVPAKYDDIFQIVAAARDAAIDTIRDAFAARRPIHGWEVDRACRNVIDKAGYGEYFCHRTGHSIGQETHGNGANMDDLETHDERLLLPRTCFSVEPGIYLPEFGVRSEVNVYISPTSEVHVTGGPLQMNVVPVLSAY